MAEGRGTHGKDLGRSTVTGNTDARRNIFHLDVKMKYNLKSEPRRSMRTDRTQTQLVMLQEGAKNRKLEVKSKTLGSFEENYQKLLIKNFI